jgi:serine/threonine protein kinase
VGDVIQQYELEDVIAEGATGRIYRARHLGTGQQVALKVLLPALATQPQAIRRFRREAEAGLRLQHPRAVKLYEFGVAPEVGIFLVMELIEGQTLSSLLKEQKKLAPKNAILIALQTCEALEKAHSLGIFHRDLKPSNIMLQEHPSKKILVKVCDFGAAHLEMKYDTFDTRLTLPGMLCGTPGYMAPEQITQEKPIGAYTDIYAVGVLLFEMLTGKLPFLGDNIQELLMNPLFHQPRPLLATEPLLTNYPHHERLNQIIQSCLARQPHERAQSINALRMELLLCLPHTPPTLEVIDIDNMSTLRDTPSIVKDLSFLTESHDIPTEKPPSAYAWQPILLDALQLQRCRNLVQSAPLQICLPGQSLLSAQEGIQQFYLVKHGEIRLVYHEEDRMVEVDRIQDDGFFGVTSFFSNALSSLTAEAIRVSEVYRVDQNLLAQWLQEDPSLRELFRLFHREYLHQEIIRYSPFFATIPPEERAALARSFTLIPYSNGQILIAQGQPLASFYLIASGRLEVQRQAEGSETPKLLRYLRAGQCVGEIAFLYDECATATIRAASNTVLMQIAQEDLRTCLKPYPRVTHFLRQLAHQRLRQNQREDQLAGRTLIDKVSFSQ